MVFMLLEWVLFERLAISALLGGIIGVERELHAKPAGLRTHVLVCVGATMFTLLSISISSPEPASVDISRIAAGVVTGIGFLAAGTIFMEKNRVRGLTTAADLWVLAAIGMSVGLGYYLLASAATAIALLVLILGRFLDNYLKKRGSPEFDEKG